MMAAKSSANGTIKPSEAKDIYNKMLRYEKASDAIKVLRDVNKIQNRTIEDTTKEDLRDYLQNIGSSEKNLRGLSRYLYYRSHVYFRIIKFFSSQFDFNARTVIPNYDLIKENDVEKTKKTYFQTLKTLDSMNISGELLKMCIIAFREDVAYGCTYYDKEEGIFIMPLDPDYCRINGFWGTSEYSFQFDMSYWKRRQDQLELMGEPWSSMWKKYNEDTTENRWQSLPPENMFMLKFRFEDYDLVVPPFSGLFNSLLSLISLEDIQSLNDEQQIYKLVYMPMDTLSGTKDVDDWCITPEIMVEYFNKLIESGLPEDYITAAIVPGKELKMLDFSNDASKDVDRVSEATQTLLDTAGGGELLMGSNINNTAAFNAALKANTEFAISSLLPQIECWINRFISIYVQKHSKIKFMKISIYTRDDYKKNLLESCQYGMPNKLSYNTLNGFSELDTLSMNFLEEKCLGITDKFVPLQSSHTQTTGKPKLDDSELTAEGSNSRNYQ